MRNNIEITRLIRMFAVQSGWDVLMFKRERANRCFNCSGRPQRMRSERFRSAYRNLSRVFGKNLFNCEGFRCVIQLCRASVRVDVINLLGSKFRIGQSFAHRADA